MQSICRRATVLRGLRGPNDFRQRRFKSTILENWSKYWKSLYADYKTMVVELVAEMQEKPAKSLSWLAAGVIGLQLARNNPNEADFQDDLRRYSSNLILVAESCQNPETVKHFKKVEQSYNEGLIERTSFGVVSILWIRDYNERCNLYKSQCEYLQPGYFSLFTRIVDIGFMGKWWNIYRKYHNFDINNK